MWVPHCDEYEEPLNQEHIEEHQLIIMEEAINSNVFYKNLVALMIFFALLIFIPNILFVGLFGMLLFVFINPRLKESGRKQPDLSHYLKEVDFKLIFFFICLFVLVYCFEVTGIIKLIEEFINYIAPQDIFLLSIFILVFTSILSGFLDNVPVTVIFIPVIHVLVSSGFSASPLLIAFILGINLGGNFLPQGSAADMMTLELSTKYCVDGMNYKKLLKIGGLFALFHILLGIGYLAIITFFFY